MLEVGNQMSCFRLGIKLFTCRGNHHIYNSLGLLELYFLSVRASNFKWSFYFPVRSEILEKICIICQQGHDQKQDLNESMQVKSVLTRRNQVATNRNEE